MLIGFVCEKEIDTDNLATAVACRNDDGTLGDVVMVDLIGLHDCATFCVGLHRTLESHRQGSLSVRHYARHYHSSSNCQQSAIGMAITRRIVV